MQASAPTPVPIGERIAELLRQTGQTPAWLAEKAGVERSTVSRILNRERNPTAETLQLLAPALGVELGQLVAGSDAETRVKEAESWVRKTDYEAAVRHVLDFERKANDLSAQLRTAHSAVQEEKNVSARLRAELAAREAGLKKAHEERDEARREAAHNESDARRYREALERAVADVALLRGQITELQKEVDAGHWTGKVGAALAGVAAAVSVASYLRNDSDDNPPEKRGRTTPPPRKNKEKPDG